ncbi:tRNA (adenosine(37)-N6)-threonylcarbamoyltransferase complex transferase subunit TsaD [candidate division WOR-1 bacterium RIFOXYB2_FULL_48_7]|uniref:tRNA N6-adenosine threonylcarbamoyltransferase n=1 Tax=candidate division WOR-1 bacterium RIFOXYB2_FULL_48_7 TaxID=1802583 RepID=A0A1F4TJJ7_UNCSA|nr:MAG: tRNA (adenosine(37)-N6)-threonylcarbamoyltransferase complex transferase subunit TsaD [candidate division WOR-1 bacterium RIFOXYB2_FULL_48_7]
MLILSIETSCDETSVAIIGDNCAILANLVSSQIDLHRKYGGIVPEIASRKHIEVINPLIKEALEKAKISFKDLTAVAVTYGPGLIGSLLVGLSAAKAIAYGLNIPLLGVNHLAGHIYANFITSNIKHQTSKSTSKSQFPFICLLVSGGHTMLVLVESHGKYKTLGRTRDDAAGEAFDKIARFLNLGYPGGPIIDKLAKTGNPQAIAFKRPMIEGSYGYDFSFSGLKTAVINLVSREQSYSIADIAASFQQAVVDVLVDKTIRAADEYNCQTIALAGGVSANSQLRTELQARGQAAGLEVIIPDLEFCTDNAAMIGAAAYYQLTNHSPQVTAHYDLSPVASLRL